MSVDSLLAALVVAFGAAGTFMLLPHRHATARPRSVHVAGGVLVALAICVLALFWTPPGFFLTSVFFYAFAGTALAAGVLMVTSRNPVYSALWFAAVVLATSGLFLLAGAQFLAAGTIIVYAGAIIVTFLFVIMLAQVEGSAVYDRAARSPARATFCCYVLLWAILYTVISVQRPEGPPLGEVERAHRLVPTQGLLEHPAVPVADLPKIAAVVQRSVSPTARLVVDEGQGGARAPHVAGLGGTLFTDHLIAVEIAGAILFVALVGAAAIATPRPPVRPTPRA
jgi:NADH-quinone oxidoreductase subunit J